MKKSVLIGLVAFLVFSASFSLFFYDEIFHEITGKQIFLDNGFEQEPGAFRPSNSGGVSLSPGNDCEVDSISSSHAAARFGDTVSIYVDGKDGTNCDNSEIEIYVFERDGFFDDEIIILSGNFIRNRATIDWKIGEEFSYLFDELFEGKEIELYFGIVLEDKSLKSDLLLVNLGDDILLQPANYQPIGYGCTNAFFIDRDCDGYAGTDAHSPRDEIPPFGVPDFVGSLGKDANDFDPTINTPASAAAIYGGLDSAQDFKDWIQDLICLDIPGNQYSCYTHLLGNVYFVAPNGNNANGQVNNPNAPYREVDFLRFILQPGDIVVVRGGYNGVDMGPFPNVPAGQTWPNYFKGLSLADIDGTPARPVLVIAAPGERAWYNGYYNSMGWNPNTHDVIVDGIEINGDTLFGQYRRSGLGIETNTRNIILRNMEFTRHPAEIFGSVGITIENLTFDSVVVHDSEGGQRQPEHGIYINNAPDGLYHKNMVIKDSLFYNRNRHGLQLRPAYDNLIIVRNIFHSNALRGIELKGGIINSVISDNLFFNNALMPFLINRESLHANSGPIDNVAFIHNTIWVGRFTNGMGDSCWVSLGGGCQMQSPNTDSGIGYFSNGPQITFTDMIASNNVIYLTGGSAFFMNWLPTFETAVIQKNFIYSTKTKPGSNPPLDLAGMYSRCLTLPGDGTHDHTQPGDGWCVAPDNIMHHWSLNSFQNLGNRPFINDNVLIPFSALANLFTDINENYNHAPGSFNFNPVAPNIATDNSLIGYNTLRDIKGNLRDSNPDAGAYEYLTGGSVGPTLASINPPSANLGSFVSLTFSGLNFDSPGAVLQQCTTPQNCFDLSGFVVVNSQTITYDFTPTTPGSISFRVRNLNNQVSVIRNLNIIVPPPVAPDGLTANTIPMPQGATQLLLNWNDLSDNEVDFEIQRRSVHNNWVFTTIATPIANVEEHLDTGLISQGYYEYRIRSRNSGGQSEWYPTTGVVWGVVNDNPPAAPTNLAATALSTTSVLVTWDDNANNEYRYQIHRCAGNSCFDFAPVSTPLGNGDLEPNTEQYTDSGLTPGTYRYLVAAYNVGGWVPSTNVEVITNPQTGACSTHSTQGICESNNCEWVTTCSISSPQQSSGGPNRCVDPGTASYTCIANQCGASCTAGGNECGPSAVCSATCGCIEQTPSISGITLASSTWSAGNLMAITGTHFATDAQVRVNNVLIDDSRLTKSANEISFVRNAEEFNVGSNTLSVLNPTSSLSSSSVFTLTSTLAIQSIVPSLLTNDLLTTVDIFGTGFDPNAHVLLFGGVLDLTALGLTTYVDSGRIQLTVLPGLEPGNYDFNVLSGDGLVLSAARTLTLNYPFFYVMSLDNSAASMESGQGFSGFVRIESWPTFITHEPVAVSVNLQEGINVEFPDGNDCLVDPLVIPYPSCEIEFTLSTTGLSPGNYDVVFDAISSVTSVTNSIPLTITITSPNVQPPSGGGGGGGGGGSRPIVNPPTQCDNNIDDDGDGNEDYPADLGCSSVNDNSELDPSELVEEGTTFEEIGETLTGNQEDVEIRVVFWLVLGILIAGIAIAVVLIVKTINSKRTFYNLSQMR